MELTSEQLENLRKETPEVQGKVLDKYFPTLKMETPEIQNQVRKKYGLYTLQEMGKKVTPEPKADNRTFLQKAVPYARPVLEYGGMVGGGALATPGTLGLGTVAGAGIGYAAGRQAANALEEFAGLKPPSSLSEAALQAARDVPTGAAMEAGGQVGGKIIGKGIEYAGKGIKQVLGATTGAGPGTIEEALKGSQAFKDAMRGKVSGEELVENVKGALNALKEQRGTAYRTELAKLTQNTQRLDTSPIKTKLIELLKQYGVKDADIATKMNTGKFYDFSRSTFGKSASKDVEEIADMVTQWGSREGDNTPVMLDTLKRRLGDFYSDSSQARQFVASLESTVKKTITDAVPQYEKMTRGYKEATDLIKDVEKGLMLKKGMTADQTLRRLTSAMRENFEMRRDLVNILGEKTGEDLGGQIAGYAASQLKPRGLMGSGPGLIGQAYLAHLVNPKFWPLLFASSPRAVGEFLTIYGKGIAEAQAAAPLTYKTLAFGAGKALENPEELRKYTRKGNSEDLNAF